MEAGDGQVDDQYLIRAALGGDPAALDQFIKRYDRLVRFTIYKRCGQLCMRDPYLLESIASDTWVGFINSMRKRGPNDLPLNLSTYLIQAARNRSTDVLRRSKDEFQSLDGEETVREVVADAEVDPGKISDRLEELEALRECVASLSQEDQRVYSQIEAISLRKWNVAGQALGIAESTLRSRWTRILNRLKSCMESKLG